jgi:hypothetical protein
MSGSVRRRCRRPSRFFAKATPVSSLVGGGASFYGQDEATPSPDVVTVTLGSLLLHSTGGETWTP